MTDFLANRSTVTAMVAAMQRAEATIRRTFAEIGAEQTGLDAVFVLGGCRTMRIDPSYGGHSGADWEDPDRVIERLRRTAWSCIVERMDIRRVMSDSAWQELEREIEKGEVLPVTEANVVALASRFAGDLRGLFTTKVREAFDWLRPRHATNGGEYKTNKRNATEALGPRIVVTGVVEEGFAARFRVRSYAQQRLLAIESVFRSLDGQGYGTASYYGELHDAIEGSDSSGETRYFRFRVFANGNMHLSFRRLDLLARFNALAGGMNLRRGTEEAAE